MSKKIFNLSKLSCLLFLSYSFGANVSIAQTQTQNQQPVEIKEYQGKTIDKIKSSGKIVIGVRTSSVPFSYTETLKDDGKPIGYAVDICNTIVDKYKIQNGLQNISTQYVFVSAKNRLDKVRTGEVDLECGSTTNNAERREKVYFSVPYYIASAKIITLNNRNDIFDLFSIRGKNIGYIKGSTMDKTLDEYNKYRNLNIKKIEVASPDEAMKKIEEKVIDAFTYDDLIVYALKANSQNPNNYKILSDSLSIEPESIMMRKNDKEFSNFVDEELKNLIRTGQVQSLYNKWFLSPIAPKGKSLDLQPSKLLKDVFRFPTTIVGN